MVFHEFRDDYKTAVAIRKYKGEKPSTRLEHFKFMKTLLLTELLEEERAHGKGTHRSRLGFNQYSAMLHFEELGRPYLKVESAMAGLMCRTRIDIAARHLRMPVDAFEIRLPDKNNPLIDDPTYPLRAILVVEQQAVQATKAAHELLKGKYDNTVRVIYLFLDFGESADVSEVDIPIPGLTFPIFSFLNITVSPEESLATALDRSINTAVPGRGYEPSVTLLKAAASLAVASTFFMSRQHTMIFPDIHPRFKQRWMKAQKTADQTEIKQIQENCKKLNHYGWNLRSSEIELPAPVYESPVSGDSATRGRSFELKFSHLRSGHLRMQPYGPRDNPSYDVKFIPPTVVRDDLPPRPHPGFILKDSLRGIE